MICTECQGMTQLAEKITTSRIYKKMIMRYCSVYNQIASDVLRCNNHAVFKPMTNELQLVLINVLIRSIFDH